MKSIKFSMLLVSVVALAGLSACNKGDLNKTANTSATGGVAATVNGTPISNATIDNIIGEGKAMGRQDSPEARKAIINQLAIQMIVSQEALKKKLDATPEVIDQINLTKQAILANAFAQDYIKSNPVTDDMLKAEYEKIKAQMSGTEYKARHILVKSEAEAQDIIAKLKANPKQFEKLAKEKTTDQGSKNSGGELGWFDPHGMVPEFGAAVAKLEKGKFTLEPVKTQYGYHVILLEDTRTQQPPALEQVKPQLSKQLQQQNMKKFVDDLMAKAKIEITGASAVEPTRKPE